MKKLYTLLFFVYGFIANAQIVNIPDANFKAKLLSASASNGVASTETPLYNSSNGSWSVSSFHTIDTNGDGEIQVIEAQAITSLDVYNSSINDLTGIEEFVNLQMLRCGWNSITTLNTNGLIFLKQLTCDKNQIASLDLSNSNGLTFLSCERNLITSLNLPLSANLIYLDVYWNSILNININNYFGLKYFNCSRNQISNLIVSNLINLEYFNCGNNSISNLDISNLINLKELHCFSNQLTILNVSNLVDLINLNCNSNQLSVLNIDNLIQLKELQSENNILTSINLNNNVQLEYLRLSHNLLNNIDLTQNTLLHSIFIYGNQLTSIDLSQNLNLEYLYLSWNHGNFLTNLNVSNNILLKELFCSINQLSSLDVSQNVNLEILECRNNQLTSLDVSQNVNLGYLSCSNNQLTSLDVSQNVSLIKLSCDQNLLSSLDVSQNMNLNRLDCYSNDLLNLNIKNNNIIWNSSGTIYNGQGLNFEGNPNLQYICADEEDVAMVQSKINAYGYATTCHVNSYCSFTPSGTFYTINGNNHFDGNANGCDSNDFGYPYLKFNVTEGTANGNFIANETGAYFYDVHAATHTLTPQLENPTYFNISPTSVTVDFPAQASPFTQDFCITPNGVHHDLEVIVIPLGVARPGFDASYKIVYKNKGNQLANPVLTFAFDDAVMDYLSASVSATSQSTGLLTWNLGTLAPLHSGNFVVNFNLNAPTETPPLNGGDFLNYTATINPIAIDETPTDNVFTLNQTVVNSYDPNDKICLEGETINPSMIGEYVHYQIRFENTGTYPAQNVVVKDMIDTTKFDIATLQMVSTSHSCYTRITGNKVEFIFENINLPFDDATNDGYVVFKIKTLPTLTINSTISNTAEIYFDYNFPIVTNTATSTYQVLANQDFDFANEFSLYPNPVKNLLSINAKKGLEIQSLEIYNTFGQLVIAKPNFEQTIDVSVLPSGTYFIKASTEKGSGSMKFVKQ